VTSQPKEKIEESPKSFLNFLCFTLPRAPINTLNTPNNKKNSNLFIVIIISGIIFCQIDKIQIISQFSFCIILRYQNWKGAPPSFKIKEKKLF